MQFQKTKNKGTKMTNADGKYGKPEICFDLAQEMVEESKRRNGEKVFEDGHSNDASEKCCETCKHEGRKYFEKPCNNCTDKCDFGNWAPKP